ncbi:hypothetical protein O6H91_16G076200 [Diphasiastrum complanatum]|nr:hypothetical protein O6H91_16G076200 [Diphasiastrum complanatum]KAJ7527920.1 hypothetical protein O6H91_16G076200 [Diphasiastrum complanatum]
MMATSSITINEAGKSSEGENLVFMKRSAQHKTMGARCGCRHVCDEVIVKDSEHRKDEQNRYIGLLTEDETMRTYSATGHSSAPKALNAFGQKNNPKDEHRTFGREIQNNGAQKFLKSVVPTCHASSDSSESSIPFAGQMMKIAMCHNAEEQQKTMQKENISHSVINKVNLRTKSSMLDLNVNINLQSRYKRKEKSLALLTDNFFGMFGAVEGNIISISEAAVHLGVAVRRIYDIANVFETLHIMVRKAKGTYIWLGMSRVSQTIEAFREAALQDCNVTITLEEAEAGRVRSAHQDLDVPKELDKQSKAIPSLVANGEGDMREENSMKSLTKRFIQLFFIREIQLVYLEEAASTLTGPCQDPPNLKTKVRRLYDIANVLTALSFIEKARTDNKKAAFRWLGVREALSNTAEKLSRIQNQKICKASVETCASPRSQKGSDNDMKKDLLLRSGIARNSQSRSPNAGGDGEDQNPATSCSHYDEVAPSSMTCPCCTSCKRASVRQKRCWEREDGQQKRRTNLPSLGESNHCIYATHKEIQYISEMEYSTMRHCTATCNCNLYLGACARHHRSHFLENLKHQPQAVCGCQLVQQLSVHPLPLAYIEFLPENPANQGIHEPSDLNNVLQQYESPAFSNFYGHSASSTWEAWNLQVAVQKAGSSHNPELL